MVRKTGRGVPVAVDQEPVGRDGVVHGQRGPPPQLGAAAFGDRLGEARLTVHDGPHVHLRDPGRGAQVDVGLGVQRGGLVRDVQGRAVVVDHGYPFTAPAVRPDTMYRCSDWKTSTVGIAVSNDPAQNMPKFALRCPAMRP